MTKTHSKQKLWKWQKVGDRLTETDWLRQTDHDIRMMQTNWSRDVDDRLTVTDRSQQHTDNDRLWQTDHDILWQDWPWHTQIQTHTGIQIDNDRPAMTYRLWQANHGIQTMTEWQWQADHGIQTDCDRQTTAYRLTVTLTGRPWQIDSDRQRVRKTKEAADRATQSLSSIPRL